MKVAAINTEAIRGGAARTSLTLIHALNEYWGQNDACLFHTGTEVNDKACINMNRIGSRQINAFFQRICGDNHIQDFGLARRLVTESSNFDVIHLHNLHGYYLNYRYFLNHLRNKPIVWTWHDMWPITGRCGFSDGCEKWVNGCEICPDLSLYPRAWIDHAHRDYLKREALWTEHPNIRIVCPSNWLRELALLRGVPKWQVSTIPNPVEISNYITNEKSNARAELGIDSANPILLFVAANCNDIRKGFSYFAKTVAETGYTGIAVGIPPLKNYQGITFVGPIGDSAKLNMLYSSADAYVITSLMDNYPNTVIEAFSSGTPVFGFAAGGIPEQVPNKDRFLAPPENHELLALKIKNYFEYSDSKLAPEECRAHAVSTWSPRIIAKKYAELFEQTHNSIHNATYKLEYK